MAPKLAPSLDTLSPPHQTITTRKQLISSHKTPHGNVETKSPIPVVRESETKSFKIWVSNVTVNKPKKHWLTKSEWRYYKGVAKLVAVIMLHGLAMLAPFTFSWGALWLALILGYMTGVVGISFSFHRNLTHKSFTLPKWLEYSFAYLGSLAFQEDPIEWVRNHRSHHKYVDSERDPHSPTQGFWFSHMNWIFCTTTLAQKRDGPSIVKDLEGQYFYKFIRNTYLIHQFALGSLLYAWGGFPYVVWGMGVRIVLVFHTTFCVNSVCHIWGTRSWNTPDLSKNNWWVALMTGGEGWHNNHHAFEYSARHGLEWWEIDTAWYLVRFLEIIGVAKDVKVPSEAHKQRMAYKSEGGRY